MRKRGRPLNFDGRHSTGDNVHASDDKGWYEGEYRSQEVRTPFGTYTRHTITEDDGTFREVEPSTLEDAE